ncbi:MAG: ATP-dependent DNA ligase, partial [Stutzerimonas sp.]
RIFVDYLRNQRGASTVAAYSVRARPGLGVSLPVSLDEMQRLEGADQWRLDNVRAYLAGREDPWATYAHTRQRLTRRLLEQLRNDS